MERQQRLQRLLSDPVQAGAHLGLGDHGEPGLAVGLQIAGADDPGAALAAGLVVVGDEQLRLHGLQPVHQGKQGLHLVGEPLRRQQPLGESVAGKGVLVRPRPKAARGYPALIPEPVTHQAKQEQDLQRPQGVVEADEAPLALGRPPQIGREPLLEHL